MCVKDGIVMMGLAFLCSNSLLTLVTMAQIPCAPPVRRFTSYESHEAFQCGQRPSQLDEVNLHNDNGVA